MSWLPIALVAAAMTSAVNIADKIVIERYFRDSWSFPFFIAAFLGLYSILILLLRASLGQFQLPSAPILLIALLPGLLQFASSFFYTRAMLRADAATVAALNQVIPLFALLWGWIFFGNVFSPVNYFGLALLVVCCAILGMEQAPGSHRFQLNPAVWLVIIGALLRSLGDLSIKLTLNDQDFWNTFALSRAVLLPISLLMLATPGYRRILVRLLKERGRRVVPGMAVFEAIAMIPLVLSVLAYSLGPLALVTAVLYSTPLFVLLLTTLMNRLRPGFVPERAGQLGLGARFVLIAGALIGVLFLRP
jgi:drug/metabolite transporter (DMT)-like permease